MPKLVGLCGGEGTTAYRVVAQREEEVTSYLTGAIPPPPEFAAQRNIAMSVFEYFDRTVADSREKATAALRMYMYVKSNEVKKRRALVLSVEGNAMKCGSDLATTFGYNIIDVQASQVIVASKSPKVHYLGKARST